METTTSKPAILEKPVWFITGCSTGFGRELAKHVLVEPSGLRTDWAGRSANESKRQIDDYAAAAGGRRSQSRSTSGKQPGDPVRAAHAIVKAVESTNPPHHLLLGNAATNSLGPSSTTCTRSSRRGKPFLAGLISRRGHRDKRPEGIE